MPYQTAKLSEVLKHRKGFITIDDSIEYKRCQVQLHRRGVKLRDKVLGALINTKKQQVCRTGDFIVAEMDAKFGGYGFIGDDLEGAIVSSHYYLFDIDRKKLVPEFLATINKTDFLQHQIKAKGSTNYSAVRPADVLSWEIPLPSLEKQKEIADAFIAQDAKLTALNAELSQQEVLLQKLQQAILQDAVQGNLTPRPPLLQERGGRSLAQGSESEQGSLFLPSLSGEGSGRSDGSEGLLTRIRAEKAALVAAGKLRKEKPLPPITDAEKPFELPEGWVWARLGEVTLISEAGKSIICKERPCINQEWGIIKMSAISSGSFIESENKFYGEHIPVEMLRAKIEDGDFLITRASGSQDLVGKSVVVKNVSKNLLLNDKTIRYVFVNEIETGFINLCNNSHYARLYYSKTLSSASTTMKNITREQINNLPIPLPPLAEQQTLVEAVERALGKVAALRVELARQREMAVQLQRALLHGAFGGGEEIKKKE